MLYINLSHYHHILLIIVIPLLLLILYRYINYYDTIVLQTNQATCYEPIECELSIKHDTSTNYIFCVCVCVCYILIYIILLDVTQYELVQCVRASVLGWHVLREVAFLINVERVWRHASYKIVRM